MNQTLDERARGASQALRAAAGLRPGAATSKRTRPMPGTSTSRSLRYRNEGTLRKLTSRTLPPSNRARA